MDIFNYLSNTDKNKIIKYIDTFAARGNTTPIDPNHLSYILRFWSAGKEHFFKAFGEKFIISKEITVNDKNYLNNEMRVFRETKVHTFVNNLLRAYDKVGYNGEGAFEMDRFCSILLTTPICDFVDNTYRCRDFTFYSKDKTNKVIIKSGCKLMKVLGKVAKLYGLESEYESVRNAHSMILNGKRQHTKMLHLSIHPLDFITMSDNDNGWESCMNWTHETPGSYRQGTVEVMNSSMAVVAYISDKDYMIPETEIKWNSKSWREIFLVNDYCIFGMKGYPYANEEYEMTVVNWLAELMAPIFNVSYKEEFYNLRWNSDCFDEYSYEFRDSEDNAIGYIGIETGCMYNDAGTENTFHYSRLSNLMKKESCIEIEYSGPSECMCCGMEFNSDDLDFDDDQDLVACGMCADYKTCCDCGRRIYNDDGYTTEDGELYCEYCFDSYTSECDICGARYRTSHLGEFEFGDFEKEEYYPYLSSLHICRCCAEKPDFNFKVIGIPSSFSWGGIRKHLVVDINSFNGNCLVNDLYDVLFDEDGHAILKEEQIADGKSYGANKSHIRDREDINFADFPDFF